MRLSEIWMPEAAHCPPKGKPFFEGWYFKHTRRDGAVLALIPGISCDENGWSHAFIQIIATGLKKPLYMVFAPEQFRATTRPFTVDIGGNHFSLEGVEIHIHHEGHTISGRIKYRDLVLLNSSPANPGIMGPFSFAPGMACLHGVLSLRHRLEGEIEIDGERWQMDAGVGYIEKDWGVSFPKDWLWMQANQFKEDPTLCFTMAVAHVPYAGICFSGMIGVLLENTRQRRFATYNGGRVAAITETQDGWVTVTLKKGRTTLIAHSHHRPGGSLRAPQMGGMVRSIDECPSTELQLIVREGGQTVLEATSTGAGIECVGNYHALC